MKFDCVVHHNCIDLAVRIEREDSQADWELTSVRVPSCMPGEHDSENIIGWIDRTIGFGPLDEMLDLAIEEYRASIEEQRIDEAMEATA